MNKNEDETLVCREAKTEWGLFKFHTTDGLDLQSSSSKSGVQHVTSKGIKLKVTILVCLERRSLLIMVANT